MASQSLEKLNLQYFWSYNLSYMLGRVMYTAVDRLLNIVAPALHRVLLEFPVQRSLRTLYLTSSGLLL